MKATRRRLQKGSLSLRAGGWFCRYYSGKHPNRRMVSHRLADKNDVYYSKSSVALRKLMIEHMASVNEKELGPDTGESSTIACFYEGTYLPWVAQNKKESTHHSYKTIWQKWLKKEFGSKTLDGYRTSDASKFLTRLADDKFGRNYIGHVRSLMSGIFSHAVNLGQLDRNPMREAKCLSKMKAPKPAESYSLREVEDMISCLAERPDAQLLVGLCAFLGLRPSECAGLQWNDVDLPGGFIYLRRGVVRGVVGDLKTVGSAASLPIIEPVRTMFELQKGRRTWVFENREGKPRDMKEFVWRTIKPAVEKWNAQHKKDGHIKWLGLYGLRRTAASLLWSLTGDTQASQLVLRHSSPNTTVKHYLVADRTKMFAGLKLLEAHVTKGKD